MDNPYSAPETAVGELGPTQYRIDLDAYCAALGQLKAARKQRQVAIAVGLGLLAFGVAILVLDPTDRFFGWIMAGIGAWSTWAALRNRLELYRKIYKETGLERKVFSIEAKPEGALIQRNQTRTLLAYEDIKEVVVQERMAFLKEDEWNVVPVALRTPEIRAAVERIRESIGHSARA